MYCGAALPAPPEAEDAATELAPADPARARELLKALSADARALMPPEVLARLKEQAAADGAGAAAKPPEGRQGVSATPDVAGTSGTFATPGSPVPRRDPPARRKRALGGALGPRPTTFDRITAVGGPPTAPVLPAVPDPNEAPVPAAAKAPLVDEDDEATVRNVPDPPSESGDVEALGSGFYRPLGTNTLDELPAYNPEAYPSLHDIEPVEELADEGLLDSPADPEPDASLVGEGPITDGLSRAAGPFGPRTSAYRLILLPDPSYKGKAHWLRHRLSGTTGMDLYTAVQSLQRDTPSLLLATEDKDEAEEKRRHLLEGELKVLLVDRRSFLDDIEPIYVVDASGPRPGPVSLTTWSGVTLELNRDGIAWAAFGEVDTERSRLPMMRERNRWGTRDSAATRSFDDLTAPYLLLDVYLGSQRRPLRFRSDRFDFQCLGDERGLAAAMNLRTMASWLSADAAQPAPLDDLFKRLPRVAKGADEGDTAVPRRELDFTEYGLLRDLGRREFG